MRPILIGTALILIVMATVLLVDQNEKPVYSDEPVTRIVRDDNWELTVTLPKTRFTYSGGGQAAVSLTKLSPGVAELKRQCGTPFTLTILDEDGKPVFRDPSQLLFAPASVPLGCPYVPPPSIAEGESFDQEIPFNTPRSGRRTMRVAASPGLTIEIPIVSGEK